MNMVRCYKDYKSGMPLGPERKGETPLSPADREETFLLLREEIDRLRALPAAGWRGRLIRGYQAEMAWL